MSNDLFRELDQVFNDILAGTSQAGRVRTARAVGKALRKSQQQRIKAQQNRKVRLTLPAVAGCCVLNRASCLSGRARSAASKLAWRPGKYGRTITGFDEERNDIRTFYRSDIERYIEINTRSVRRSTAKKVPMFQRLRSYRFLKMRADAGAHPWVMTAWRHALRVYTSTASATRSGGCLC